MVKGMSPAFEASCSRGEVGPQLGGSGGSPGLEGVPKERVQWLPPRVASGAHVTGHASLMCQVNAGPRGAHELTRLFPGE